MRLGNSAGKDAMLDIPPLRDAALLQLGVQAVEVSKSRHRLPQPSPGIRTFFSICPFSRP